MPRKSPQQRYADTVRVIARRAGLSWKQAQAVYRTHRAETPSAKLPTHWRTLKRVALDRIVKASAFPLHYRSIDGFGLKATQEAAIEDQLTGRDFKTISVTANVFVDGIKEKTKTITRTVQTSLDFWLDYHDMIRELLDDAIDDTDGEYDTITIVPTSITVL